MALFLFLRKVRDSNPRYPKGVYRISSPARSITLPTFLSFFAVAKVIIKNEITNFLKEIIVNRYLDDKRCFFQTIY